ncbi:unnamed protein product [Soboliphyme baturini]|uniref:Uncharacterized protein n=1 Tax=Soboliphyme baturini TaxID=241478 RepID=A0A183J570_9BILA|nr:unnamed protein product [Soboliphyme baturini]
MKGRSFAPFMALWASISGERMTSLLRTLVILFGSR